MSAEESQQDQSMEEILQSIKRIISEDEEEGGVEDDKNALADDAKVSGSDVLELTDMLDEEPLAEETPSIESLIDDATAVPEADDSEEGAAAVDDIMDLLNVTSDELAEEPVIEEVEPEPEPEPEPEMVEEEPIDDGDGLISDGVANDAAGAFASLASSIEQEVEEEVSKEMPEFRSGNTVEDLVIESLRPMLREWLDDNLSQMVKRLVKREIEKIATQRHF